MGVDGWRGCPGDRSEAAALAAEQEVTELAQSQAHGKADRLMAALFINLFTSTLSSLAAPSLPCLKRCTELFFFLFIFK